MNEDLENESPLQCARCTENIVVGQEVFFRVAVEASADPTPVIDSTLSQPDVSDQLDALFKKLNEIPESEAMDQVHRRLSFCLCSKCYRVWIENPVG
jgi:hypothetical protein